MKHAIGLILAMFVTFIANAQNEKHQVYEQKTANKIIVKKEESKKILQEIESGKAYLVDVRTEEEYNKKHLKNAQNINIRSTDFADKIKKLDKTKPIYFYCRSGNRSGQAADTLQTFGYLKGYNIGGLDSLIVNGLPAAITH